VQAARRLVKLIGVGQAFIDKFLSTVDRLVSICPLLAARFACTYRDDVLLPQRTKEEVQSIMRLVCCRLGNLSPDASNADIEQRKNALRSSAAEMLGMGVVNAVDPAFISSRQGGLLERSLDLFANRPITETQRGNLDVAFATVEPLRRLVAVTLTQRLIPEGLKK